VFQFDAGRPLASAGDVVVMLSAVWQPLTVASWQTAPNRQLDGRSPMQALRDGDLHTVQALAHQARANTEAHGM
jgi:hypothetical protein